MVLFRDSFFFWRSRELGAVDDCATWGGLRMPEKRPASEHGRGHGALVRAAGAMGAGPRPSGRWGQGEGPGTMVPLCGTVPVWEDPAPCGGAVQQGVRGGVWVPLTCDGPSRPEKECELSSEIKALGRWPHRLGRRGQGFMAYNAA